MHDPAELSPSIFLDVLARCPHDRHFREVAVSWYTVDEPDDARCAWHMSRLAVYHPQSLDIGLLGRRLLILRPRLRRMLEQRLLRHCWSNVTDRGFVLINLGLIASAGMRPNIDGIEDEVQWRRYFDIPMHVDLSSLWDPAGGSRAVEYLKLALALPDLDREGMRNLATIELMSVLEKLHRDDEIIDVGNTMPRPAAPDALICFGNSLFKAGRFDEARVTYQEAIDEDAHGYERGGHASLVAYLRLAEIELQKGDKSRAQNQLLAASILKPCCHTTGDHVQALADALMRLDCSHVAKPYLRQMAWASPSLAKVVDELIARYRL